MGRLELECCQWTHAPETLPIRTLRLDGIFRGVTMADSKLNARLY